ncbi:hypothetical protein XENOCAPTIV_008618, partial [Xenoophorus captivus]
DGIHLVHCFLFPSPFLHRTIIYLSAVYAVGQVILAVSSIHDITDGNRDGEPDTMAVHMPNTFHMAWQIPQYFLMTSGEVVFSVTGLEFSYSQWAEYILFASLLVFVCIIFAIMAYFYTYIDPASIEALFVNLEPEDKKKNLEMTKTDMVENHNEKRKISDTRSNEDKSLQSNF